jgi:hypothetical protein
MSSDLAMRVRCLYCYAIGLATLTDAPSLTCHVDIEHVDGCDVGESGLPLPVAFEIERQPVQP